jgi:hypothetical protein
MSEQIHRRASGAQPHDPEWDAIRRRVDEQHAADIEAYYRRPLDADEIAELVADGYKLPSIHGEWARPPVERGPLNEWHARTDAEVACLTCGRGPGEHQDWCWRGAEEHDAYIAARIAEAQAWQPAVKLPKLSAEERAELGRIFDNRMAAMRARENLAKSARRVRPTDPLRGTKYAQAALGREAAAVAEAPVGLRNDQLSRSAWAVARFTCEGLLTDGDVLEVLVPAAIETGLPAPEARCCVRAALRRRCRSGT